MLAYFLIIIALFFLSIVENINTNVYNEYKIKSFYISFILLVLFVGLRWETGTDWEPYVFVFDEMNSITSLFEYFGFMEFGYLLINFVIRIFTANYTLFLLFHAILMYFILIKAFNSLTNYVQLTLMLFFAITLGNMGSNRQLIALSLGLLGLAFLINGNKRMYFVLIGTALFFHLTSILFGVYYFLNRRIKSITLLITVGVSYVLGKTNLPYFIFAGFGNLSFQASQKTDIYLDNAAETLAFSELSTLGLLKRLLVFGVFLVLRNRISLKFKGFDTVFNGYVFGLIFYFFFSKSLLVMISRGSIYFSVMEALLLTSIMYILPRIADKIMYSIFLFILSVFFMYQSVAQYPDLFEPYKAIFINMNFYREMY